jgi:hypothetical protein
MQALLGPQYYGYVGERKVGDVVIKWIHMQWNKPKDLEVR